MIQCEYAAKGNFMSVSTLIRISFSGFSTTFSKSSCQWCNRRLTQTRERARGLNRQQLTAGNELSLKPLALYSYTYVMSFDCFRKVESEMIGKLDVLVEGGKGDTQYKELFYEM